MPEFFDRMKAGEFTLNEPILGQIEVLHCFEQRKGNGDRAREAVVLQRHCNQDPPRSDSIWKSSAELIVWKTYNCERGGPLQKCKPPTPQSVRESAERCRPEMGCSRKCSGKCSSALFLE